MSWLAGRLFPPESLHEPLCPWSRPLSPPPAASAERDCRSSCPSCHWPSISFGWNKPAGQSAASPLVKMMPVHLWSREDLKPKLRWSPRRSCTGKLYRRPSWPVPLTQLTLRHAVCVTIHLGFEWEDHRCALIPPRRRRGDVLCLSGCFWGLKQGSARSTDSDLSPQRSGNPLWPLIRFAQRAATAGK